MVILYILGRFCVEIFAVNLWLGTVGTRIAIYRDSYFNFFC